MGGELGEVGARDEGRNRPCAAAIDRAGAGGGRTKIEKRGEAWAGEWVWEAVPDDVAVCVDGALGIVGDGIGGVEDEGGGEDEEGQESGDESDGR